MSNQQPTNNNSYNSLFGSAPQQQQVQPSLFTNAQIQQQAANHNVFSNNLSSNQVNSNAQVNQSNLFSNIQQQQPVQPTLFTNAQVQQQSNPQNLLSYQPQSLLSNQVNSNVQVNQANVFSNAQQQQYVNQTGLFGNTLSNTNYQQYQNYQPAYTNQQIFQPSSQPSAFFAPQQNYSQPSISYNDDQPLVQKVKQQLKSGKIDLQIRAQRTLVKLKTVTEMPAMISLKSSGGSRTSVDLICVIDNSGSMSGQKISLVKATVKFLLQTLTPSDRLSIITFNSSSNRLCGLKCVSGENMNKFLDIIHSIQAGGGTNINSGLQLALKTIRDRKHVNKATSIFLLSDGQDKGAEYTFKQSLQQQRNKNLGVFSLNSFGFGSDHDQDLMNKLCLLKDGAFYFIKQLATLDEAFCNALGAIISLVANQITIKLNNVAKNLMQGVRIKKVYGKMWQKINDRQYKIKLSQIMSGITKDFVFELEIPSINVQVGDLERDHFILQGIFTAKGMLNNNLNGECGLQLTLLNQNQNIPDSVQNVEVIENYLRVKATQVIEQNLKKADQHKFKEAQAGIDTMIQCIQDNKKARKQKMCTLLTDLQQIKQKCSQQQYGHQGRKIMTSIQTTHTMQNNFQYSNCVQTTMLNNLKAKKN